MSTVKNPASIHYKTNMLIVRPLFSNTSHQFKDEFRKHINTSVWKNRKLGKIEFVEKAKIIEQ